MDIWLNTIVTLAVGALISLSCVYVAQCLSDRSNKLRADALEIGFYSEFEIIQGHLQDWLKHLVKEFDNSIAPTISIPPKLDLACIDTLHVELIVAKRLLTNQQRKLLLKVKSRYANLVHTNQERLLESEKWDEKNYRISRFRTAFLIANLVEVLFHIERLLKLGRDFQYNSPVVDAFMAKAVYSAAGMEFREQGWEEISFQIKDIYK